jgi:hypothetical protein
LNASIELKAQDHHDDITEKILESPPKLPIVVAEGNSFEKIKDSGHFKIKFSL